MSCRRATCFLFLSLQRRAGSEAELLNWRWECSYTEVSRAGSEWWSRKWVMKQEVETFSVDRFLVACRAKIKETTNWVNYSPTSTSRVDGSSHATYGGRPRVPGDVFELLQENSNKWMMSFWHKKHQLIHWRSAYSPVSIWRWAEVMGSRGHWAIWRLEPFPLATPLTLLSIQSEINLAEKCFPRWLCC